MELSKDKIIEQLVLHSAELENFGLVRLGLFGSAARNETTQCSDLDFIAEFNHSKKTYKNFIRLVFYLEQLFNCKIDLISRDSLPQNRDFTNSVNSEAEYVTFMA
ncbi:MAG: nucleotidyltransferase domain-containing protein [Bacteroidota bacterium]